MGRCALPKQVTDLDMLEDKPFEIGMEMELNIETLWREGEREVVGYRFSPI